LGFGLFGLGYLDVNLQGGNGSSISALGLVAVGESGARPFRSDGLAPVELLVPLTNGTATEVTPDSTYFFGSSSPYGALRLAHDGTIVELPSIESGFGPTTPQEANSDGTYAVGVTNRVDAFIWCEDLGTSSLGWSSHEADATGVSADGQFATGRHDARPAIWNEDTGWTFLPTLRGDNQGLPLGMSADGTIIVGQMPPKTGNTPTAFVWTATGGTKSLKEVLEDAGVDLQGFYPSAAHDISPDGTAICGEGFNIFGQTEGFICRIPRNGLTPYDVRPNRIETIFGQITGGDRRDTFKSDDSREAFKSGVVPNFASSPITVEFTATSARQTVSKLEFKLEMQADKSGLTQHIDLYNWDASSWETVDARTATKNADSLAHLTFTTNPQRFVRAMDGRVRGRLRVKSSLPQAQPGFQAKVDYVSWRATP